MDIGGRVVKRSVKTKTKRAAKRDLFAEPSEGMKALAEERLATRKLRTVRPQVAERNRNGK